MVASAGKNIGMSSPTIVGPKTADSRGHLYWAELTIGNGALGFRCCAARLRLQARRGQMFFPVRRGRGGMP